MTVLVTGGTGFVGPKVVHALRAAQRPVRVLARKPEKQERLRAWGCEVVPGDMADPDSLRRAVEGCDAVVHLVALPPFSGDDAVDRVMVAGTNELVSAAEKAAVGRFVLMSALGTSAETKDVAPYYRGKWAMEERLKGSPLAHTVFRPSFVFGRDGGILEGLIRATRFSPVTPVLGTRKLQPIWVDDVAAFFATALDLGEKANGTWELAGPDVVGWGELADRVRRILGKRRLLLRVPSGLLKAGAVAAEPLPPLRGARAAVRMLEHSDNVTDIAPAVEAFGIHPISLDEQLRRAVT
jgi:NADH dehydrogenase